MRLLLGFAILLMGLGAGGISGALLYSKYQQTLKEPPITTASKELVPFSTDFPPLFLLINSERWYAIPTNFSNIAGADPYTDGMTFCKKRKIYYKTGINNKARLRMVLWHEIEHAGMCRPREDDSEANWMPWASPETHHKVYLDGMFWAEFAMTNPDFMKWAANE